MTWAELNSARLSSNPSKSRCAKAKLRCAKQSSYPGQMTRAKLSSAKPGTAQAQMTWAELNSAKLRSYPG